MSTERESTQAFLAWLREPARVDAERVVTRVLGEVGFIPQRRSFGSAWRTFRMNKLMMTATAAAVLAIAVVGYSLLPGRTILGPGATPSPGSALLARGTFVAGPSVDIDATSEGSSVTGTMTLRYEGLPGAGVVTVDLRCARTAEGGLLLIGGIITATTSIRAPMGGWAAIAFERGEPVDATVWTGSDGESAAVTCLEYLDAQLISERSAHPFDGDWLDPIDGTVDLGAPTPGDVSLPRGVHLMTPVGVHHAEDRVMVTITAEGWSAPDTGSLSKDLGDGNRVTLLVLPGDHYTVPRSICDWRVSDPYENPNGPRFPPSADDFVSYVLEQTYDTPGDSLTRDFSAPVDITVDGHHGQRIVNNSREYPDGDASACDEQRFCTVQDRDKAGCLLSHPTPGALDTLWIVESSDTRIHYLVVAATGTPGTELRAEMNALVGSLTFVVE